MKTNDAILNKKKNNIYLFLVWDAIFICLLFQWKSNFEINNLFTLFYYIQAFLLFPLLYFNSFFSIADKKIHLMRKKEQYLQIEKLRKNLFLQGLFIVFLISIIEHFMNYFAYINLGNTIPYSILYSLLFCIQILLIYLIFYHNHILSKFKPKRFLFPAISLLSIVVTFINNYLFKNLKANNVFLLHNSNVKDGLIQFIFALSLLEVLLIFVIILYIFGMRHKQKSKVTRKSRVNYESFLNSFIITIKRTTGHFIINNIIYVCFIFYIFYLIVFHKKCEIQSMEMLSYIFTVCILLPYQLMKYDLNYICRKYVLRSKIELMTLPFKIKITYIKDCTIKYFIFSLLQTLICYVGILFKNETTILECLLILLCLLTLISVDVLEKVIPQSKKYLALLLRILVLPLFVFCIIFIGNINCIKFYIGSLFILYVVIVSLYVFWLFRNRQSS